MKHKNDNEHSLVHIFLDHVQRNLLKNCKRFGSVPIGVCEMKLNYGDFTNESPKYSLPDDN